MLWTNSSPEGRGWPEGPGEGCKNSFLHPSPRRFAAPSPFGRGIRRQSFPVVNLESTAQPVGKAGDRLPPHTEESVDRRVKLVIDQHAETSRRNDAPLVPDSGILPGFRSRV